MTDTQVKYQTLMENQRHNLEMERLGQREAKVQETKLRSEMFVNYAKGTGEFVKAVTNYFGGALNMAKGVGALIGS